MSGANQAYESSEKDRRRHQMSDTNTLKKVERLIVPIVSDLQLDLYDLEFRGGTLRVTIDRPAGVEEGLDMEAIALASRLIGRELDHEDPMGGHYTLEVTSPGLERSLRTPVHFQKSIGKTVALRLRDIVAPDGERSERRLQGVLIAAEEQSATIQLNDAALTERVVPYDKIDRARTVFVWGPAPKPGTAPSASKKKVPETSRERRAEKRSGLQANKKVGGDAQ
jgi:ribosome maturation factor RimP